VSSAAQSWGFAPGIPVGFADLQSVLVL